MNRFDKDTIEKLLNMKGVMERREKLLIISGDIFIKIVY